MVVVGVFDIMPKCVSSHYLFYDLKYVFFIAGEVHNYTGNIGDEDDTKIVMAFHEILLFIGLH